MKYRVFINQLHLQRTIREKGNDTDIFLLYLTVQLHLRHLEY